MALNKDFYDELPSMACETLDNLISKYGTRNWFSKAWNEYRNHVKSNSMNTVRMPGYIFKKYIEEDNNKVAHSLFESRKWKIDFSNDDIQHHGTEGMQWGKRLYQNEDGTYTELGKERRRKGGKLYSKIKNIDIESAKKKVDNANQIISKTKETSDKGYKVVNKVKNRKGLDLSNMTNQELADYINRQNLERQYTQLIESSNMNFGEKSVKEILDFAGDVAGFAGSALGLALLIKQLRKGE